MRRFLPVLAAILAPSLASGGDEPVAQWIWRSTKPVDGEKVFFRREIELPADVTSAVVTVACDDWHRLWVNGRDLGAAGDWKQARSYDVTSQLRKGGRNVIAVEGRNESGAAGMALRFRATLADGRKLFVMSDGNWQCHTEAPEHWPTTEFSIEGWPKVAVVGKMGDHPWGLQIRPEARDPAAGDVTAK